MYLALTFHLEDDLWLATCADYLLSSFAKNENTALKRLECLMRARIRILGGLEDVAGYEDHDENVESNLWMLKV